MYNDKYEKDTTTDLTTLTGLPTFDAGTGTCDNFALEYHLKIGFEPVVSDSDVEAG